MAQIRQKYKITTSFDFKKLAKSIDSIADSATNKFKGVGANSIKESLDRGMFEPLSKSTIDIRREGHSPNSGYTATASSKQLVHTGKLRDSIKQTDKGVQMLKYGVYQNRGYTTKPNKFTKSYLKHTGRQLANKKVPARPFISNMKFSAEDSKAVLREISKRIKKALHKNG